MMGGKLKLAAILLVALVIICELSSTAEAAKKPGRKPNKKPGGGGASKKRTYYQKGEGDKCKSVKDCNIYLGLDCHPKKGVCVCIFSLQEYDKVKGCQFPGEPDEEKPDAGGDAGGEGAPTDPEAPEIIDEDDLISSKEKCDECSDEVPDGGNETPEEKRRRKKFSKLTQVVAKRKQQAKRRNRNKKPTKKPARKQ